MPATLRIHNEDPRQALLDKIGDLSDFEIFHNKVLCAIYLAPEKTKGGIILTDQARDEDKHQGKVALIEAQSQRANDWLTGCLPSDAPRSGQLWVVEEAALIPLVGEMEEVGLVVKVYQQAPTY